MTLPLWPHRTLIWQMIVREIRLRYHGSQIGVAWSLITPLFMLAVYTFVFSSILQARWHEVSGRAEGPTGFALTMFAGLIPYNVFSDTLVRAPALVLNVPNYVKKVVFPLEVLPVVALGAALFQSVVNAAVLVAGTALLEGRVSPLLPLLPLAYLPLILLSLGLGWTLAALGVYVRDVAQVMAVLSQALLFMSPVIYPAEAIPEPFRNVLYANPLTPVLETFRHVLLWGEMPDWGSWLATTLLGLAVAVAGYRWFNLARVGFADVM